MVANLVTKFAFNLLFFIVFCFLELLAHGVRRIAVTNRRALQFVCRTELRVRSGREVLDSTSMGVYRVSIE